MGNKHDPFDMTGAMRDAHAALGEEERLEQEQRASEAAAAAFELRTRQPVTGPLFDSLIGPFLEIMARHGNPGLESFVTREYKIDSRGRRDERNRFKERDARGWIVGDESRRLLITLSPAEYGMTKGDRLWLTPDGRIWRSWGGPYSVPEELATTSDVEKFQMRKIMALVLARNGLEWS